MNLIESFQVDHRTIRPGVYFSRLDRTARGEPISTFDLRFFTPNKGLYLTTTQAHTLEHFGATYFRTVSFLQDKVVYFGPMGCRTGFYLVLIEEHKPFDLIQPIVDWLRWTKEQIEVPGCSEIECGNYEDLSISSIEILLEDLINIYQDNPGIIYGR